MKAATKKTIEEKHGPLIALTNAEGIELLGKMIDPKSAEAWS